MLILYIDNYQYEVNEMRLADVSLICKALGDSNRLEIVQMLSNGEKCGCRLLERFSITQPTLSHHMKILVECGLVNDRKEGKWHHYSLNCETLIEFKDSIGSLTCESCCTKKRRGAGNKGGRGNAGASKQHWTWTAKFDPDHYGKHGFKRPQKMIKKVNPVNLSYLEEQADNLIESGKASKDGDSIVIDVTELGYDKVLAKGKITKSFIISAPQFSASAIEKIEEMEIGRASCRERV